jgi:DNA polymerase-3 subunit alpha
LSNELANTDNIQQFINECRHMKIEVLAPDVNQSGVRFTVDSGRIRFGMAAIKNVGEIAVQNIIEVRDQAGSFTSLANFCDRISTHVVNRKVIECLIKCGAFDSVNPTRGQVFADLDYQMNRAANVQRDRERGQAALFADVVPVNARQKATGKLPEVVWSQSEMLGFEKELLGFYVTGHPLSQYAEILRRYELA